MPRMILLRAIFPLLLFVGGSFFAAPVSLAAQEGDALRITALPAEGSARVDFRDLLGGAALRRSLEGGLPLRISLVVELWRDRLFDAQEGRFEWRATVRHDPLTESYRVEAEGGFLRHVESLEEAEAVLAQRVAIPLRPRVPGRHYYLARMEIETLSLSDLEELRRWLQGDLAPAMEGSEAVGSAVGRGVRRAFVRILGLPTQRFEARSQPFEWGR